ncbi:NAD(P)-dependent oxidoreductase [Legionella shakespearei]|nr:NAD(P)-dependent oxidoreductase [Legionella shakespearei]
MSNKYTKIGVLLVVYITGVQLMQVFNKDELDKDADPIHFNGKVGYPDISLPVLDSLLERAYKEGKANILGKTAIFYVHHPLQTSINVVDALIHLGAKPKNLFILGKRYSECESVVSTLVQKGVHYQPCSMQTALGQYSHSFIRDINWLWAKMVEKLDSQVEQILVMDHGGHAITYLPLALLEHYKVIGIEKTTAGFINSERHGTPPIPVIDVANSAAKRFLESSLIAETVVNKIDAYLPENINDFVFGVVGFGAIGKAVVNRLQQLGCRLIVHDIDSSQQHSIGKTKNIIFTNDMSALVASADYIFGCSGRDISEGQLEQLRLATRNKTLISCSSEDKEYLSFLQMINRQMPTVFDPMDDIEFKTEFGASVHLLRGGFPVNFDNTGESVPANDIQLTRSLVVAAVLQASDYLNTTVLNGVYALDATYQRFVINEWLKHQDDPRIDRENLTCFLDEDWLANHSNSAISEFRGVLESERR